MADSINAVSSIDRSFNLELERTSGSTGGVPAVAASGYMAKGGSPGVEPGLPPNYARTLTTNSGVVGSSLDYYATSARKAGSDRGDKNSVDKSRRVRRFYQRYFTGVGVGGALRVLTLTTSDEALEKRVDIHRNFRRLVLRLRRRWGRFEYMGVREVKGDRQHLHLVFRGEYMAQVQLSAMWQAIHASKVVDIRAVWGSRGGARYLAKYLAKGVSRYWASYNWVFRGWVGWSKAVRRITGRFPSRSILCQLARLDVIKRLEAMWFLSPVAMMGSP